MARARDNLTDRKQLLVVLDVGNTDLLRGIQEFRHTHAGFQLYTILTNCPPTAIDTRRLRGALRRFHPDGILAVVHPETRAFFEAQRAPTVNVGDGVRTTLPTIFHDQRLMGRLAAEHLMDQGLAHFAYWAGDSAPFYWCQLRRAGFVDALARRGRTCHVFEDRPGRPGDTGARDPRAIRRRDDPAGEKALRQWLRWLPKPVGLHTASLTLAMQVVWTCQESGLHVPKDVAVIGGQDSPPFAGVWEPTLSAIDDGRWRLGQEAMRLLDRLMRGGRAPQEPVLLPPLGVVQRQSSDVRGLQDPEVAHIRRLIRQNAHRPLGVKELLTQVPLSRRGMELRFQRVMGHSLHDEVVAAHVERAQMLLRETALPVAQVAAHSGYASYNVFAAAFRKQTGLTPGAYRRRWSAA